MGATPSSDFLPDLSVFPAYFRIKAVPKQPKTEFLSKMDDGTVKIRVAAVPEKGRANTEIVRFLSEESGIPKGRIEIVSGLADAFKLVRFNRDA